MLALSFLTTSSAIPRNPQIRSRNFEWKKKNVFTAFRPTWTISQTVLWCWELFSIRLGTSSPQVQQIRMKEIKTGKSGFWKEADRKDTKSFVFFLLKTIGLGYPPSFLICCGYFFLNAWLIGIEPNDIGERVVRGTTDSGRRLHSCRVIINPKESFITNR